MTRGRSVGATRLLPKEKIAGASPAARSKQAGGAIGSMAVSKSADLGSSPSRPAKLMRKTNRRRAPRRELTAMTWLIGSLKRDQERVRERRASDRRKAAD